MRLTLSVGLVGGLLLTAGGGRAQEVGWTARQQGWYSELEPARAAARQTGKPLLVVFRCQP